MFGFGLDNLYLVNEWLTIAIIVVLFIAATELGYLHGRKRSGQISEHVKTQVITMQAAVIGLFALLLGFTFSMAMIRYDARKQLVLDEANAIETCYLRADLLDPADKDVILPLLKQYLKVRISFYRAGLNEEELTITSEETDALRDELWRAAVTAGRKSPNSVIMGLFIDSLNTMIEFEARRLAAIENHVPQGIFLLLYFAGILTMGLVGYGFGIGNRRNLVVTMLASILVAAVILMIVDLDRPRRGMVKVGQQSLLELQDSLKKFS